jgi:D-sedoheptulose 7-phosphate isomerase
MDYFRHLASTLGMLDDAQLAQLVALCKRTMERGGTLWLAGNGGSASVAQHWACDLSKQVGMRVQALGANPAVLTAWANDSDYANTFAAELTRLARPEDTLICLSCSGESPNIYYALREARARKLSTALITRWSMVERDPVDALVFAPTNDYGIAEDCFAAIGHYLAYALRADT